MSIHREGYSTLAVVGAVLVVINGMVLLMLPHSITTISAGISILIFAFFAHFFRNPARVPPASTDSIFAPADGTIVAVETIRENEYFQDNRIKLSIYMSALNVHLNRVPVNGKVIYNCYHPGKYLVAFHPKASELNERNSVVVERTDGQRVLIRQIAGILARRIRFYLHNEQSVVAGDELGFIKFGSRCDVFLPLNAQVRVQMGQKVKGGETVLAQLEFSEPL